MMVWPCDEQLMQAFRGPWFILSMDLAMMSIHLVQQHQCVDSSPTTMYAMPMKKCEKIRTKSERVTCWIS
mgnify:CR=1 FL=1